MDHIGWIKGFLGFLNSVNSSSSSTSKIISNDTKLVPISRESNVDNPLLNNCVGVWVGGHPRANFSHTKDSQENSTVSCLWDAVCKTFVWKTDQKLKIKGVQIAWVKAKSNVYPSIYIKWFIRRVHKVRCVFAMVIWSEFRMSQYRDDDHL